MPGIGIISNPFAKVNKKNPEHNTLMWYVLGNKGQFEVTQSLPQLSNVCLEFREQNIDVVGILGGDGTISLTLSAIANAYQGKKLPKILLLRGGTVNVLAQNLGIFGKPKTILDDFLQKYHGSSEISETIIHSLVVNGRLGFLFANGIASRFLSEFYKNKSSAFGAGVFLGKTVLDVMAGGRISEVSKRILVSEKYTKQLENQENAVPCESSLIFASTVPKLPFGIPLFRKIDCSKPFAEAHFFSPSDASLAFDAARIIARQNVSDSRCDILTFEKMRLNYDASVEYSLDGDVLQAENGCLEFGVGASFTFLSPYGKII